MANNRKVIVKLIESERVSNHRLISEFFAKKINERGEMNGRTQ